MEALLTRIALILGVLISISGEVRATAVKVQGPPYYWCYLGPGDKCEHDSVRMYCQVRIGSSWADCSNKAVNNFHSHCGLKWEWANRHVVIGPYTMSKYEIGCKIKVSKTTSGGQTFEYLDYAKKGDPADTKAIDPGPDPSSSADCQ